jgi:hypothetical protein
MPGKRKARRIREQAFHFPATQSPPQFMIHALFSIDSISPFTIFEKKEFTRGKKCVNF